MAKPRIVAADEDHEFLVEVVSLLTVEFDVVGIAADGLEALELVRFECPDVAVLGYHLPTLSGIEITRQLTQYRQAPAVVICSAETHSLIVQAARRAGALGYVFKRFVRRDLVPAVKLALQGQHFRSYSTRMSFDDFSPEE